MKTLNFVYTACFGKCDYSDPMEGEIDIPDEIWDRIRACHEENPQDIALYRDEFKDIYCKCEDLVMQLEGENLLECDPEVIYDYLEDTEEDFDRESYQLTLKDAIDYMDACIMFTIREDFPEQ